MIRLNFAVMVSAFALIACSGGGSSHDQSSVASDAHVKPAGDTFSFTAYQPYYQLNLGLNDPKPDQPIYIIDLPSNGSVVIDSDRSGHALYYPDSVHSISDRFSYSYIGSQDAAEVAIDIHLPELLLVDDIFRISLQDSGYLDIFANDLLTSVQSLNIQDVPSSVRVTVDNSGTPDFINDDRLVVTKLDSSVASATFRYQVITHSGVTASARVDLEFNSPTVTPIAVSDAYTVLKGTNLLRLEPLLNDTFDVPGAEFSRVEIIQTPRFGQVSITLNEESPRSSVFDYEFDPSFSGPDTFVYALIDQEGDSSLAQVDINVVSSPSELRYSISGVIQGAQNLQADSDINNQHAVISPNNYPSQAKAINNPSNVFGFVNRPSQGVPGLSFLDGDVSDFYRVSLSPNEIVSLSVPDPSIADLDLYLYRIECIDRDCSSHSCDPQSAIGYVNRSIGVSGVEEIHPEVAGDYLVEVCAVSGSTNYRMSVNANQPLSEPTLESQFAHLKVLLDNPSDKDLESISDIVDVSNGPNSGPYSLYDLPDDLHASKQSYFRSIGKSDQFSTLAQYQRIKERLGDKVHLNYHFRAMHTPTDPLYPQQWHYPMIDLPRAWDITQGDESVRVAVIDTGVVNGHEDLIYRANTPAGYDFVSDPSSSLDGDGIDSDPSDPGDGFFIFPSSFHGTHVAGTIAAQNDNGLGGAGVSPSIDLIHLRVLGLLGFGTDYDITQAILYAAGLENDSGELLDPPADILNMSLGGSNHTPMMADAISRAVDKGVVVIAAAGNASTDQEFYPAALPGVIAVSALDANAELAPYSNYGAYIDISAPGGDTSLDSNNDGFSDGVLSTLWDEASNLPSYARYQGTSMASPHVAGVVALMKSVNPQVNASLVNQWLDAGLMTLDLGDFGPDAVHGAGIVNAYKSVQTAMQSPVIEPGVAAFPASIDFSFNRDVATIQLIPKTADATRIESLGLIDASSPISIEPNDINSSGLGSYTLSLDRSNLAVGDYGAEIRVLSNHGETLVPVRYSELAESEYPNASLQTVYLVDPDSLSIVSRTNAYPVRGRYSFAFQFVRPGDYLLYTSSDLDNDQRICDSGEACGAFPLLSSPQIIRVDRDVENLEFNVGLN